MAVEHEKRKVAANACAGLYEWENLESRMFLACMRLAD